MLVAKRNALFQFNFISQFPRTVFNYRNCNSVLLGVKCFRNVGMYKVQSPFRDFLKFNLQLRDEALLQSSNSNVPLLAFFLG